MTIVLDNQYQYQDHKYTERLGEFNINHHNHLSVSVWIYLWSWYWYWLSSTTVLLLVSHIHRDQDYMYWYLSDKVQRYRYYWMDLGYYWNINSWTWLTTTCGAWIMVFQGVLFVPKSLEANVQITQDVFAWTLADILKYFQKYKIWF